MVLTIRKIYENTWLRVIIISAKYTKDYTDKDNNPFPAISFPICNGFQLETSKFNGFVDSNSILIEKDNFEFSVSKFKELGKDITLSFQFKKDSANLINEALKNKTVASYYRHPKFNQFIRIFLTRNENHIDLFKDELLELFLSNLLLTKERNIPRLNVENYKRIERAKEFIANTYDENIKLADISKVCQISPFHFTRIFKKQIGYSPYDLVLKIRIENAKDLLRRDNSISHAAYDSGFNSLDNFSYSFKKIVGLSPSEYKKSKISKIYYFI